MSMSEVADPPVAVADNPAAEPAVEVFAVYGVEPEIQAYAMAKYSRSSLSMKESLKEITTQKAEKFLNTFYFQYGHRSIADLAHIALAIEKLSILAAIVVADEQRWDGQERSTRYQDFRRADITRRTFRTDASAAGSLSRDHRWPVQGPTKKFRSARSSIWPASRLEPAEMKPDAYERTLRARAFDISRYLLPLATNTSLGEIVNARTLENQVAHLLSQPHGKSAIWERC
jgi:thymidylate synthase ThyX